MILFFLYKLRSDIIGTCLRGSIVECTPISQSLRRFDVLVHARWFYKTMKSSLSMESAATFAINAKNYLQIDEADVDRDHATSRSSPFFFWALRVARTSRVISSGHIVVWATRTINLHQNRNECLSFCWYEIIRKRENLPWQHTDDNCQQYDEPMYGRL